MFDSFFDRAGESLLQVVTIALDECLKLNNRWLCTEHLLIALTHELDDRVNIAAESLTAMKLDTQAVEKEVESLLKGKNEAEPLYCDRPEDVDLISVVPGQSNLQTSGGRPLFSQLTAEALRKAGDYSVYFAAEETEPEHLLLALLDMSECGAQKVFEELSANLTFLRRQLIRRMAREAFNQPSCPNLCAIVKQGLSELLNRYQSSVRALSQLATRAKQPMMRLPVRSELMHMIVSGYLSEFLSTQVAFQRYLLEETIQNLNQRTGGNDKELTASIVSAAAQNLRAEVRAVIEHVWLNEYRELTNVLDEAEHDLVGSVIEDLWWCQSEEIALQDMFTEALDDHRRSHLLDLQKRRIEITQRLAKLRTRLEETITQCFIKHSISA